METRDPIIEEIYKLAEYEPLEEEDINNAIKVWNSIKVVPPMVEFTQHGLCFSWPRCELVFENGEVYYFRYKKPIQFGWKPQEIGGGIEEGILTDKIIEKLKDELRLLS